MGDAPTLRRPRGSDGSDGSDESGRPSLPEHVTLPLLTLITARSMDEDYAHVAARRESSGGGREPRRRSGRWVTPVVVAALGLMVAVVAAQTSRDAETQELSRAALVGQIAERRDEVAQVQSEIRSLSEVNREAVSNQRALGGRLDSIDALVTRLETVTGFGPVRGPGVRITVDNAPGADVNSEIRDEDLATLVDGLWQAGAESIAINDERLNALGGIRNTNRAIHVNGNPVTAPYTVEAIGDTDTLQADLLQSSQGQEWFALVNGLGFRYEAQNVDTLRLPAARLRPLRDVIESEPELPGNSNDGEGTP